MYEVVAMNLGYHAVCWVPKYFHYGGWLSHECICVQIINNWIAVAGWIHVWYSYLHFTLFSSRLRDAAACVWWYTTAAVSRDTATATVTPTCPPSCPSLCCPISFTCYNFCWSSCPSHSPSCIHPSYTRCSHYQLCTSPTNIYSLSGIYSRGKLHVSALEKS